MTWNNVAAQRGAVMWTRVQVKTRQKNGGKKNVHAPDDMEKVRRSDGRCLPDFSSFFPVKWKNKMESNVTEQEAVKDEFTAVPSLTLGVTCPRTQV